MRYLSASNRFVFSLIWNIRELLKCVTSLPKVSLYSYLFASSDIRFKCVISLPQFLLLFFFYLQRKRASKTRYISAAILFAFFSIWKLRHRFKRVNSQPQLALYSFSFATLEIFLNALFFCRNSLCILIYVHTQTSFEIRYFSASIRFVIFFICNKRELLKRIISLPKFSLHSYLLADSDNLFNALFLSLNSLCTLLFFCNVRKLLKRVIYLPKFSLYSYLFENSAIV